MLKWNVNYVTVEMLKVHKAAFCITVVIINNDQSQKTIIEMVMQMRLLPWVSVLPLKRKAPERWHRRMNVSVLWVPTGMQCCGELDPGKRPENEVVQLHTRGLSWSRRLREIKRVKCFPNHWRVLWKKEKTHTQCKN